MPNLLPSKRFESGPGRSCQGGPRLWVAVAGCASLWGGVVSTLAQGTVDLEPPTGLVGAEDRAVPGPPPAAAASRATRLDFGGPVELRPPSPTPPELPPLREPRSIDHKPENLRATMDLSTRGIWDSDTNQWAAEQAVGLDLHKVFGDEHGDRATLVVQGYLTRIDNQPRRAPFFESDDDTVFVHRILNLNVVLLDRGRLNLRVGHYELPFGLEQVINTNGTLRQYSNGANLGLKADWGVTLNGEVGRNDWEVGLSRGSGNDFDLEGDSWALAGRWGRSLDLDTSVGVSAAVLELSDAVNPVDGQNRFRVGVDASRDLGPFTLLGEASGGADGDEARWQALGELNWRTPAEAVLLYGQGRWTRGELAGGGHDGSESLEAGVRLLLDRHWTLSMAYTHELDAPGVRPRNRLLSTQLRYRF